MCRIRRLRRPGQQRGSFHIDQITDALDRDIGCGIQTGVDRVDDAAPSAPSTWSLATSAGCRSSTTWL